MQSDRCPETPAVLKPPQSPVSNDSAASATGPTAGFQMAKPRSANRFKLPPGRGVPLATRKPQTPTPVFQATEAPAQTRPRFTTPQTSQVISRSRSNSITSTSSSVVGGWSKEVDTASGKVYYFHAEKGITQWNAPAGFEVIAVENLQSAAQVERSPPAAASVGSYANPVGPEDLLPRNSASSYDGTQEWQQLTDQSSGKIFFYNSATGESQWERPSHLDTPEREHQGRKESISEMLVQPSAAVEASERSDIPEEEHDAPNDQNNTPEDAHPKALPTTVQSVEKSDFTNAEEASNAPLTGWRSVTDPDAGTYFFNEATGETSWDFPRTSENPPATEVVEASEVSVDTDLPGNWKQIVDPSSGSSYYYNEETGETSWDLPAQGNLDIAAPDEELIENHSFHVEKVEGMDALPSEIDALDVRAEEGSVDKDNYQSHEVLLPGWIKVEDEATLEIYFYNEVTGETSWTIPSEIAPVDEKQAEQTDTLVVEDEVSQSLPDGWSKKVDPMSGQLFYFHENSGESSWNVPVVANISREVESSVPEQAEQNEAGPSTGELVNHSDEQAKYHPSRFPTPKEAFNATNEQFASPAWSINEPVDEFDPSGKTALSLNNEKQADDSLIKLPHHEMEIVQDPSYTSDGWKKQIDESTGTYYYFNSNSGEATWGPPDAMTQNSGDNLDSENIEFESPVTRSEVEDSPDPVDDIEGLGESSSPVQSSGSKPLPAGWQVLLDPGSGEQYYYNEQLGETSWEPPTAKVVPGIVSEDFSESETPGSKSSASPTADWISVKDPSSGDVYFYNQQTGETSWEPPTGEVQGSVGEIPIMSAFREGAARPDQDPNEAFINSAPSNKEIHVSFGKTYSSQATERNGDQEQNEPGIDNSDGAHKHSTFSAPLVKEAQTLTSRHFDSRKTKIELPSEQNENEGRKTKDVLLEGALKSRRKDEELLTQYEGHLDNSSVTSKTLQSSEIEAEVKEISLAEAIVNPFSQPSHDWEQVVDESSGDVYYLNQQTGETSWEPLSTLSSSNGYDSGARGNQTGQLESLCDPSISDDTLPSGWEKLVDPTSGRPYFFNRIQNTTSWEPPSDSSDDWIQISHPSVQSAPAEVLAGSSNIRNDYHVPGRQGALACFGFGGRLCVWNGLQGTIMVHKTCSLLPSHIVVEVEAMKREAGFSGPLISAESQSVSVYLEGKSKMQSDLLWSLCLIASQSKGRLRSVDRVNTLSGPELAITDLLLSKTDEDDAQDLKLLERTKMTNGSGLDEIQFLLLKGKREEAIESALLNGHYALALLVASMCSRDTYFKAAKSYTERVLCKGSPLHTVAELYCSQLQTPQRSGVDPMMWSNNADLRRTWRKHLAAMISNQIAGWDAVAVALGDRLKELGEVVPAHVCYMVCGCSLSPPARKNSKITLLGCDVGSGDLLLLTRDSVESFCRAEAYEWAKRRGNKNAVIQSIQGFKLQYAILLSDFGLVEEAKMYIASIKDCLGFREDTDAMLDNPHPKFVALLTADREGILHQVLELESRFAGSSLCRPKERDGSHSDGSLVTPDVSAGSAPQDRKNRESSKHLQREAKRQSTSSVMLGKGLDKEVNRGDSGRVSKVKGNVTKNPAPLPPSTSIAGNVTSASADVNRKEASGHSRPPTIATPDRTAVALSNPSTQPGASKKRNPQPEQAPRSAPPNLQSPSLGFMNKLKDRIIKWQNPDAHIANPGEEMQAYYDKERKVWVFPGENPDDVVKPIGPPPSASTPSAAPTTAQPTNDPLAAMMAPPQRAPSALRGRPSSTPSPGSLLPYTPLAAGANSLQSPPHFMVFKPAAKPVVENEGDENS